MVVSKAKRRAALIPRKIRKILRELKKGLVEIYGDQLKAVYLFGSFARGEGKLPDSDIDVMIVLDGEFNHREVEKRSSDFVASLCLEHDVLISWFFASDTKYTQSRMPFMLNVRKDAVTICHLLRFRFSSIGQKIVIKLPKYYLMKAFRIFRLLNPITQCFTWQKLCYTRKGWSFQVTLP